MRRQKVLHAFGLTVVLLAAVLESSLARAQHYTVLHSFKGIPDGVYPLSNLLHTNSGVIFGVTLAGGAYGYGTVFQLDQTGAETVLYSFCSVPRCFDGYYPYGGLVQDARGNLYGTTDAGGSQDDGTVFRLDPRNREKVMHDFTGPPDGKFPAGTLVQSPHGKLSGTTTFGGEYDYGTIFRVDTEGKETVLYSLEAYPAPGLLGDSKGNLYGAIQSPGLIFKLESTGKFSVLYSFTDEAADPNGGLVMDESGNLYGTTAYGGVGSGDGYGTVFELRRDGKLISLHNFEGGGDGELPSAGLAWGPSGESKLYGVTWAGGGSQCEGLGCGTIFEIDARTHKERVLHRFTGGADGGQPEGGLAIDGSGNLYGTATIGGDFSHCQQGCGVVFKLSP